MPTLILELPAERVARLEEVAGQTGEPLAALVADTNIWLSGLHRGLPAGTEMDSSIGIYKAANVWILEKTGASTIFLVFGNGREALPCVGGG